MNGTTYTLESTRIPGTFVVNAKGPCGMDFKCVAQVFEMHHENPVIQFNNSIGLHGVEAIAKLVRDYHDRYETKKTGGPS